MENREPRPTRDFKRQLVTERLRHAPHDRETQAETGAAGMPRRRAALEFLEDVLALLRGNAWPGVPDFDRDLIAAPSRSQKQAAALCVVGGVGQKVLQHAPQHQRVGANAEPRRPPAEVEALAPSHRFKATGEVLEDAAERHRLEVGDENAGLEL